MTQTPLNPEAQRKCVDMLLEYNRTPRHRLYEYPHRDNDSDRYIATAERLLAKILAAAQPATATSVEVLDAKLLILAWEGGQEFEVQKIADDETFVGFVVKTDRRWSLADKHALHIDRPEGS